MAITEWDEEQAAGDTMRATEWNKMVDELKLSTVSVLDDHTDVNIAVVADNDILTYDTASGMWINEVQSGAIPDESVAYHWTGTHQFDSTVTLNNAPGFAITSSTTITNLNAENSDMLDGLHAHELDHDYLVNTHDLTSDIDHDAITNNHNLTTDIDHGGISGLADDDHPQYGLRTGANIWSGTHQFDSTVTFNSTVSLTDTLTVNGLIVDVTTITGDYTAIGNDDVILCNGTLTLTMPVVSEGKLYRIKNIGSGTVTIGGGGNTIDGDATIYLYNLYESYNIVCDGTNWFLI